MKSFADIMKEEEELIASSNNLMVVDALPVAFRYKHQGKLDFEFDYLRTIQSLAKSYKAGKVIIVADQGSSSFRKEIFPDYKANRKERYANQTEREKEEMELFFKEFEATLQTLSEHFLVLRYQNVEADDLAGFIVKNFPHEDTWLISTDSDWDLLVNEHTSRFSTYTRKETTFFNWDEHYDVDIEKFIDYKCIIGDKSDGIPGIPTIGPKRAIGLLNDYGTAIDVYMACPIDSKYKYIQSLNENREQILVNYELMDLLSHCEEAIGPDNCEELTTVIGEYLEA